jgi:hypothetical protein
VYKIVLPGTNASEIVVTEADRGTIAIMTTLDKLDRQIQGIHQEMIRYVRFSPRQITRSLSTLELRRTIILGQCANKGNQFLETEPEDYRALLSSIEEATRIRPRQTDRNGRTATDGLEKDR